MLSRDMLPQTREQAAEHDEDSFARGPTQGGGSRERGLDSGLSDVDFVVMFIGFSVIKSTNNGR